MVTKKAPAARKAAAKQERPEMLDNKIGLEPARGNFLGLRGFEQRGEDCTPGGKGCIVISRGKAKAGDLASPLGIGQRF